MEERAVIRTGKHILNRIGCTNANSDWTVTEEKWGLGGRYQRPKLLNTYSGIRHWIFCVLLPPKDQEIKSSTTRACTFCFAWFFATGGVRKLFAIYCGRTKAVAAQDIDV